MKGVGVYCGMGVYWNEYGMLNNQSVELST